MKKSTLGRILFVGALAAIGMSVFAQNAAVMNLKGKNIPSFTMTDTEGKVHTDKSLKGKVVVLDFWATWCGPCKAASPTWDALYKKYKDKGFVVIGVSTTDKAAAVKKYRDEHSYSFPFTGDNEKFVKALEVDKVQIPLFLYIGRDGKVKRLVQGFHKEKSPPDLEKYVKELL